MTTRTWMGGSGDWYSATMWATLADQTGTPVPGDIAFINGGTVTVSGTEEAASDFPLDAVQVTLGSAVELSPAAIAASDATFGQDFVITSNGAAAYAAFDTTGPAGFRAPSWPVPMAARSTSTPPSPAARKPRPSSCCMVA